MGKRKKRSRADITSNHTDDYFDNDTESDTESADTLLNELLCFAVEGETDEIDQRNPVMVEEVAKILTSPDDLPSSLKDHFVRLLSCIDRKMLYSEDLWLQKQALKHIEKLIELMGPYLSSHVPRIIVILFYAVDKEALRAEGLSVFHFFVKQLVNLSPCSIKHVISQIVAAFIPCLEKCKKNPSVHLDRIGHILKDLIVENRLVLKQQIRELPLLPNLPALSEVNKVIQEARGSTSLREQLQDAVNGLDHENLNVRYMMACELNKLLNLRREEVTALIANDFVMDLDVISSLISSLLRGCAEESRTGVGQQFNLVCVDCLGALGAIDPAKFKGISSERFKIECSDDDLIFELIQKHLARAFRAASDTSVQDSAALAIQELLELAGCQTSVSENLIPGFFYSGEMLPIDPPNEIDSRVQRLLDRFSDYVKEIITPFLTSTFQLPVASDLTFTGPVYRPSMSFQRWIFFWIRKLTAHASGLRSSIFSACRGIIQHALGHSGATVHEIAGGQSTSLLLKMM